ncbi:hypothetical protein NL676_022626 [Syzygium grande]|nr:hypothetical protein NL676_022626 [Syzygium grande]
MGLSSFPVAAEVLLPLLLMNTALSVSHVKSTRRSVLRAIAGSITAEAKARDPAPRGKQEGSREAVRDGVP